MKTQKKLSCTLGMAAMLLSLYAHSYPGESIVINHASGDYIITYWNEEEPAGLEQTIFVPATKIIPTIRSKFRLGKADSVVYNYIVTNDASAKQAIIGLSLEGISRIVGERDLPSEMVATDAEMKQAFLANRSAVESPRSWYGNIRTSPGYSKISWRPNMLETGGVKAGRSEKGFGFSSVALPGLSEARMKGIGAIFGYAGEGPAEDSDILVELNRLRDNDFVARPAAIPAISVPTPFNAAILIDRIQTHTHTWIAMQLLDANFSSQLDRYLTATADAYRHNQPKAGKEHIETLRKMLKKEHEDLGRDEEHESEKNQGNDDNRKSKTIDRLAARVLDFDLRYVLKRMGEDKDD